LALIESKEISYANQNEIKLKPIDKSHEKVFINRDIVAQHLSGLTFSNDFSISS
jgi:hypothetical protein